MERKGSMRLFQLFITITLLLSGLHLLGIDDQAAGQITPDVNVIVRDSPLMVDVSPSGSGIASTMMQLQNTGPHIVTCSITVVVEGYFTSPNGLTVTLTSYEVKELSMSVAALTRSPYRIATGNVNVTVKSVNGIPFSDYFINTGSFQVWTQPYAQLVLEAEEPLVETGPGQDSKITIEVRNDGNAPDEVFLQVTNRDELYKHGFSLALSSSSSLPVDPGDIVKIIVHINTPQDFWSDDYYSVDVRVTSSNDNSRAFDYSVTVHVWGFYPGFDPMPGIPIILAVVLVVLYLYYRGKWKE